MNQQQQYSQRGHTPPSAKLPGDQASYKIFVGGLDVNTKEEDLANYFSAYGKVIEKLIKMDVKTKRSRGFGFVGFKFPESVDRVLQADDHYIHGRKIDCKRAMTKEAAFSLNQSLKGQCRKIFVSNIPRDFSKQDILNCFQMYGELDDVNLMFKKKETGFCYITFSREEDAKPLIDRGSVRHRGAELTVKLAIPKDQKEPDKVIPTLDHLDQPRHRSNMQIHSNSMSTHGSYGNYQSSQHMPMHPAQARFRHSFEDESYSHMSQHMHVDQHPNRMIRGGSGDYHQLPGSYQVPHQQPIPSGSHSQYSHQYYDFNSQMPPHPVHRGSNHSSAMLPPQVHVQHQQSSPQSPLRREPASPYQQPPLPQAAPLSPAQGGPPSPSPAPLTSFEQEVFPPSFHYKGNSFGGQQGGFELPAGLRDTHRLRVMSDQQINTHYKNFAMSGTTNTASLFAPPDRRSSGVNMVPGSPGYGNEELGSIGGERERRYNLEPQEPKTGSAGQNPQYKISHPTPTRPQQPVGEFIENNGFNFKDQFLKLKPQQQGDSPTKQVAQGNSATSSNPGVVGSPLQSQQKRGPGLERAGSPVQSPQLLASAKKQKRERVRALEEEIKTLKERLRGLEEQLKDAYSTVEEDFEEKEGHESPEGNSPGHGPKRGEPAHMADDEQAE